MMRCGNRADWECVRVLLEWAKLIVTSLAISIAFTSVVVAIGWWFVK